MEENLNNVEKNVFHKLINVKRAFHLEIDLKSIDKTGYSGRFVWA